MKGYKRHDFYIRVKRAGEPSLEKHTGGYITVRDGVTYACERQPVNENKLCWFVWHVMTGLRVSKEPLWTIQEVEDFLNKLDHHQVVKAADMMLERAMETSNLGDLAFTEIYDPGMKTLGQYRAMNEFNTYGDFKRYI